MKKYICHSWYIGGVKEFDTETGNVSNAPHINRDEASFGSMWKQNGKWFAFHRDNESLILQTGKNVWRLQPPYNVKLRGGVIRKFCINNESKKLFCITYIPKGLFARFIDPTYDAIDEESDDFFLYITNMWKSWGGRPYSDFIEQFKDENI